jgi:hypothetical protein
MNFSSAPYGRPIILILIRSPYKCLMRITDYKAPHRKIFSSLLLLPPKAPYFLQSPVTSSQSILFSPVSCYFLPKHPIFSSLLLLPHKTPYFLKSPVTSSQSTLFSPVSCYFLPKHPIFSSLLLLPPRAPYFLQYPVTSSQSTLFSNTLGLYSSHKVRGQVSLSYTRGKLQFLYISTPMSLDCKGFKV